MVVVVGSRCNDWSTPMYLFGCCRGETHVRSSKGLGEIHRTLIAVPVFVPIRWCIVRIRNHIRIRAVRIRAVLPRTDRRLIIHPCSCCCWW